jgi:hypothetical protein
MADDDHDAKPEQPVCPVCGEPLVQERCKLVCRSRQCVYRIVFNCSEF